MSVEVEESLSADQAAADAALLNGEPETEAPAPEPALPEPSSEPETSGPPRDSQGRFTSATPSPEASPEVPGSEPPGEPPAPEAWKFRAEGSDFGFDGAQIRPDGLYIPVGQRDQAEELIRQGLAWKGSAQRYIGELNQRNQQAESRAQQAEARIQSSDSERQHVLAHFEQLIEASQGFQDITQSPIGQWLANAMQNWHVLKAEAKAAGLEKRAEADRKRLEEIDQREESARLRPMMDSTLSQYVEYYGTKEGLDRATLEEIFADLKDPQYESLLFVRAPNDDPVNQIRKGELAIRHDLIEREVKRVARYRGPQAPPQVAPKPTVTTAPPQAKPKVPPTVSATRGPAPKKTTWVPKTKEEADDALLYGHDDD